MNAQQLKNAILQEAIEGRLVPQDPNDEPASALLDRIRKEKARLVKEGKLKKKDLVETPVEEDEKPFEIPESWEWTRLGNHISAISGLAYKKDDLAIHSNEYVRVLRGGNIFFGSWCLKDDDVMIGKQFVNDELILKRGMFISPAVTSLEHMGKTALIREDQNNIVAGGFVLMLIPHFNNETYWEYLNSLFQSGYYREKCKSITNKSGQAFFNLSRAKLLDLLIPLPPLAEQKRIVAKIEELLPKVEEYGKAQEALDKLNEELPERLKKSILQEAIEGRLVPQDPNDEPASVLLDKIRKEKERLVKEGKLKKKDLEETPIEENEIPFKIPESWEWVRHNDLFDISGGSQPPKSDFSLEEKEGYIRLYQIRDYGEKPSPVYIPISKASKITQKGDILLARYGGSLGKVFIAEDGAYNVAMAKVEYLFNKSLIDHDYLYYYYNCSLYQDLVKGNNRSAQGGFNKEDLGSLLFPLPPLAEQKRIVAKIEQLMKEIDKLKA